MDQLLQRAQARQVLLDIIGSMEILERLILRLQIIKPAPRMLDLLQDTIL
jgi:hypothetical protein